MNVVRLKKTKGNKIVFDHSKKVIKSLNENKYDDLFHKFGEEYGIDWLFLKSQVKCESNFNPKAVNNSTGAKGLCQLTDDMWEELIKLMPGRLKRKKIFRPFDPSFSIMVQCLYLEYAFKRVDDLLINKNYLIDWTLAAYKLGLAKILGGRAKSGRYIKGMLEGLANEPIEDAWIEFGMDVFDYISEVTDTRDAYRRE